MVKLHEVSRAARQVPGARRLIESGDPARRATRLARSGIVDADLYAAQLGIESMSVEEAARHYVREGFRIGLTLNVLLDPFVIRRGLIRTDRPVLYDYLNSQAWHAHTTAVWSVKRYVEHHPEALDHPAGPVGHLWQHVTTDPEATVEIDPGGTRRLPWAAVYPVLFDATVDWAHEQRDRGARFPKAELTHPRQSIVDEGAPEHSLVSIILPVRNRPGALRRAVESVRAQTWSNWELIIIDDGSWDDTLTIARLLAERDARIRVLANDHSGVCVARNAGIAEALGTYVAFLDSDNAWEPSFLRDMATAMERRRLDSAYATIEMRGGPVPVYRYGAPAFDSLMRGNSIDLNTLVVRRDVLEAVGGFDPSLRRAVDYDLILRLARRGPLTHVETLGAVYDNSEAADDRISTTEAFGWNTLVRLRQVDSPQARPALPGATVACLVHKHDPDLPGKLAALAEVDADVTAVVAAVGVKPDEWRAIRCAAIDRSRFSPMLFPAGEPYAYVVNLIAARALDRETFVVVEPRSRLTADSLQLLLDAPDATTAVMPITLTPSGTTESVGAAIIGPRPDVARVLADHPPEDLRALDGHTPVDLLSGRTFSIAASTFGDVGGLDPLLYNEYELEGLSLRLRRQGVRLVARTDIELAQFDGSEEFPATDPVGTRSTLRRAIEGFPMSDVDSTYAALGMRVAGWRLARCEDENLPAAEATLTPILERERTTRHPGGREVPRLRWAIQSASPAGPTGEAWGDTHFARSLAAALRSLGQDAVVDARDARERETSYVDDVRVVLRGLDEFPAVPGKLNYLWVISHPDMVTRSEAIGFDRVFAASLSWADRMTARWDTPIRPLLQCTDPERFAPTGSTRNDEIVFVGNSRGVPRPTVMESVRAGIDLKLYGSDWERFIPAESITGERVDNRELGALYGTSSIVLNDHWPDMQREGFISNRLFDVVAAGGRVLSDDVEGLAEVFRGAVATYQTVGSIAPLLRSEHDALFPDAAELSRISEEIRTQHSFLARARVLLDAAIADMAGAGDER